MTDAGAPLDTGIGDGLSTDAEPADAGPPDAGPPDAGPPDAGPPDGGETRLLSDPDGDGLPDWVAYFPLDDCGAEDIVASHTGTVFGLPTPEADRFGMPGAACRFPLGAYVEVPYFAELTTPQYSISAWVRVDWATAGPFGSIYTWRDEEPIAGFAVYARNQSTYARWANYMAPGNPGSIGPWVIVESDRSQDDLWHHVATTFDGATLKLYLDGVQVASTPTGYNGAHTRPLRIANGGTEAGPQHPFAGTIDEVLVYGRALTGDEIAAIEAR